MSAKGYLFPAVACGLRGGLPSLRTACANCCGVADRLPAD
jgi:hypothetical protein